MEVDRRPGDTKADYGTPLAGDDYELCLYENGILRQSWRSRAAVVWRPPVLEDTATGYVYKDGDLTPDGIKSLKLIEAVDGAAKITLKGKTMRCSSRPLDAERRPPAAAPEVERAPCFGATYTAPFRKQDSETLLACPTRRASPPRRRARRRPRCRRPGLRSTAR